MSRPLDPNSSAAGQTFGRAFALDGLAATIRPRGRRTRSTSPLSEWRSPSPASLETAQRSRVRCVPIGTLREAHWHRGGNGRLHGVKFFTAISAAALSVLAGQAAGDLIKVGTSVGYTEFHSPDGGSEIIPIEWPIRSVVEVNEDLNLVYGTPTALDTGSYAVRQSSSVRRRIARISDLMDFAFYAGYRVVRLRYSAGYKGAAAVPPMIKGACLELAAWHYQYADKKDFGLTSRTDATGSISRSGPPMILAGMANRLASHIRAEFDRSGERDSTLRRPDSARRLRDRGRRRPGSLRRRASPRRWPSSGGPDPSRRRKGAAARGSSPARARGEGVRQPGRRPRDVRRRRQVGPPIKMRAAGGVRSPGHDSQWSVVSPPAGAGRCTCCTLSALAEPERPCG